MSEKTFLEELEERRKTRRPIKTRIHVNQHRIKANKKNDTNEAVITVKDWKRNRYGHTVSILDDNGKVVATIKYTPHQPLSCGAVCYIETTNDVVVDETPAPKPLTVDEIVSEASMMMTQAERTVLFFQQLPTWEQYDRDKDKNQGGTVFDKCFS